MNNPTRYVAGFAFNSDKSKVLLIKKKRPAWQSGLMNAVGGKIESFDADSHAAMVREFKEETNLDALEWKHFCFLKSVHFELDFFFTVLDDIESFLSMTDEEVISIDIDELFETKFAHCISNIMWLLPMALEVDSGNIHANIEYH